MKSLLLLSMFLGGSALAGTIHYTSVSLDSTQVGTEPGGVFKYTYQTGGGCEKHHGDVSVVVVLDKQKSSVSAPLVDAQVQVVDKTESGKEDLCRSIVTVSGSADLQSLIATEVAKLKLDPNDLVSADVQLPVVNLYIQR